MRRLGNWTAFALVLAAVATAAPAHGDLAPPPDSPESKRVPATVELDWGVFADRVSMRHVVAAGETLRTIAAKELGDAARSKAIAEANPDVIKDPNRIRAGDVIWLPPVKSFETASKPPAPPAPAPAPAPTPPPVAAPTTLEPWYDAFWLGWTADAPRWPQAQHRTFESRVSIGPLSEKQAKGGTIALLPHGAALAVLAELAKGPVAMKTPELQRAPQLGLGADTLVHKEDPTVRVVGKYKLTGIAANAVTAEFERVRLDADGKPVTKTWVVRPPGDDPKDEPAPAPAAPPAPTPPGSPPAPPAIGMASATASTTVVVAPIPKAAESPAAPPADDSRWPDSTGLVVAGMGAALVAALVLIRRQKAAAANASTGGPTHPPSDPPAA